MCKWVVLDIPNKTTQQNQLQPQLQELPRKATPGTLMMITGKFKVYLVPDVELPPFDVLIVRVGGIPQGCATDT